MVNPNRTVQRGRLRRRRIRASAKTGRITRKAARKAVRKVLIRRAS